MSLTNCIRCNSAKKIRTNFLEEMPTSASVTTGSHACVDTDIRRGFWDVCHIDWSAESPALDVNDDAPAVIGSNKQPTIRFQLHPVIMTYAAADYKKARLCRLFCASLGSSLCLIGRMRPCMCVYITVCLNLSGTISVCEPILFPVTLHRLRQRTVCLLSSPVITVACFCLSLPNSACLFPSVPFLLAVHDSFCKQTEMSFRIWRYFVPQHVRKLRLTSNRFNAPNRTNAENNQRRPQLGQRS